jgi:ribonuclease HII
VALDRFKFERLLLKQGITRIAGCDEAGRGPLAGPVVAAGVIFPERWVADGLPRRFRGLNDSKQLTEEEREKFYLLLTSSPEIQYAFAIISPEVIDAINILQASLRAMNEALQQLNPDPQHSLIDGLYICSIKHPQTPLVQGDARSFSIAAASVIAKVTRDRIMIKAADEYPAYGFQQHKGYGTPEHLEALQNHGPCPLHRRSFSPFRIREPELFDT